MSKKVYQTFALLAALTSFNLSAQANCQEAYEMCISNIQKYINDYINDVDKIAHNAKGLDLNEQDICQIKGADKSSDR